ncbi:MAG: cell division topological specificity factor MinE [Synergistaceae bacterium]|nr:cell division topological specificity factor MinE [Synergistaceae bacterium]
MDFLKKLFGGGSEQSGKKAKNRLQLVLMHDRTDISPQLLDNLRADIIGVLTKYMEIDMSKIEIGIDHIDIDNDKQVALVANVPVKSIRRGTVDVDKI